MTQAASEINVTARERHKPSTSSAAASSGLADSRLTAWSG
jgi:hypothetical protein